MILDSVGYSIDTLDAGLTATLRLIQDPALTEITDRFYDRTTEGRALPDAYRSITQQRLWQLSAELRATRSTAPWLATTELAWRHPKGGVEGRWAECTNALDPRQTGGVAS